ncbi:MAG: hypothetical protein AAGA87_08585 [Pseudomonadota bacterium]
MSGDTRWLDAIARLRPEAPEMLDDLLLPGQGTGAVTFQPCDTPPSANLWARAEHGPSYIGVRVTDETSATAETALKLASAAAERNVVPVILSHVAQSGFERFGFRLERVAGQTPEEREACEAELIRFWDITVVVDANRVSALR